MKNKNERDYVDEWISLLIYWGIIWWTDPKLDISRGSIISILFTGSFAWLCIVGFELIQIL